MPRRPPMVNRLIGRLGPAVAIIVASNVAVFLVAFAGFFVLRSEAFTHVYYDWLALSVANVLQGKVWTLLTYGWLHNADSLMHILANMLVVWFLAPPLAQRWGTRRMLRFWVGAVFGGGLLCFLVGLIGAGQATTVGASAGSVALVGAWSWSFPEQRLLLMFVLPVKARWLVYGVVAVDIVFALTGSDVAVSAHFGGLIAAWLMLKGWTPPRRWRLRWRRWRLSRDLVHRQRLKDGLKVLQGGRKDDDDDDEPMIH